MINFSSSHSYIVSLVTDIAMLRKALLLVIALIIIDNVLPSSNSDLLASRRNCGFQHSDDYVRDNDKISLDEFPWVAQLLYDEDRRAKCVGSLINRRYVLTAAQCLKASNTKITGIRFGDYDVTTDKDCTNDTRFGEECSDPVQEFGIEELIPHPKFSTATAANDIGLIRLSKNVDYSVYVRPICLPTANTEELNGEEQLAVSGWGLTSLLGDETKIKKKISARLLSLDKCRSLYDGERKSVTVDHLCAVEGQDSFTCQGDSGAPLMLSVKNQWEQVGLVSFGKLCGIEFPTIYVKITSYLDWITNNMHK